MYAILSDIHGNMYALEKVAEDMEKFDIEGIILLGDLIDYGMQSNEVVQYISEKWVNKIICNIWGNHEKAILTGNYEKFSGQRGVECAKFTSSRISDFTTSYLNNNLVHEGKATFKLFDRQILAVHGSLEDEYWKSVSPEDVRGDYRNYDIVLSGHSHYSHFFTKFYEADDPERRNKHSVIFINPGSVGQPRNHNSNAQYALLDGDMNVLLRSVKYEVNKAMNLYTGDVDPFYKNRLKYGV